uniref:CUB domain-containing protein n=1 Tax=Macrostomum lignano TaxID=282301 RepID=A0A1I8G3P2_9PLAT
MQVPVRAAEIHSHRFGLEPYPANFSCEVHLLAESSQRILIWFNQLNIPDVDPLCENVLHCFNTNTPYSEGMAEAGGQTGLCKKTYPRQPLVSSQHYFTFTFRSKPDKLTPAMLEDPSAGFRLTVAAVTEPQRRGPVCPPAAKLEQSGSVRNSKSSASDQESILRLCRFLPAKPMNIGSGNGGDEASSSKSHRQRRQIDAATPSLMVSWCLPKEALCDGVVHCPNGADERSELCLLLGQRDGQDGD